MVYVLKMPSNMFIKTSLLQIIFLTANVTFLQSVNVVLAILLLVGTVVGAQYGAKIGARLKGEQLRALLARIILAVCGGSAADPFAAKILH